MTRYPNRQRANGMNETDLPEIFAGPAALTAAFDQRLADLLGQDLLGAFILVLANASFEQGAFERLRDPLGEAFERWDRRFRDGEATALQSAPDDVAVFRRLQQHGFDRLQVTRRRRAGPWELQFNQLRAFRPARMSGDTVERNRAPFDPGGFHFDKPFLRREILWEGTLRGTPLRLLFNKFPFAEHHGLLVPKPAAGKPQFLQDVDHRLAWDFCALLGDRLPGIGIGYNAYGAYASVNHLHFQTFMRADAGYPVEAAVWRHNGGQRDYPLPVLRRDDAASAWDAIAGCQRDNRTFNLLYRPGCVYLAPRAFQGHYTHSDWTGGFAWAETSGAITLFDEATFDRLGEAEVRAELAALAE